MKKTIAIIVAVEMFAVLDAWGRPDEFMEGMPFRTSLYKKHGRNIYAVRSGPGQTAAAAATQLAISVLGAEEIWNFGTAGGLLPELKIGDVCTVQRVFRWDADVDNETMEVNVPLPDMQAAGADKICTFEKETEAGRRLTCVTLASGDRVVSNRSDRQSLAGMHGAAAVDMEAAAIAITAARNGIPAFFIKGISDGLETPESEIMAGFRTAAAAAFKAVDSMLKQCSEMEEYN